MITTEYNNVNSPSSSLPINIQNMDWESVPVIQPDPDHKEKPQKGLKEGYNAFGDDVFSFVLNASKHLIRHHKSGRANPLWAQFHYIGWQCHRTLGACIAKRDKIGSELKSFGYDKNLKDKQVGRYRAKLKNIGLITITGRGLLKECKLTLIGEIVYWFYIKQNAGEKKIKFTCQTNKFTKLVLPVKKMSRIKSKKCPVIDNPPLKVFNLNGPPISPKGEQEGCGHLSQEVKKKQSPKRERRLKPPACQIPKLFPIGYANAAYAFLKHLSVENIALLCTMYDRYGSEKNIIKPCLYLKSLVRRLNNGEFKPVRGRKMLSLDRIEQIKTESRQMATVQLEKEGIFDPSKCVKPGERMNYNDFQDYLTKVTGYEIYFQRQLTDKELNKST